MKKLKVGIVGAGGIALLHANAYYTHQAAEVVAVCDTNIRAAESLAARFKIGGIFEDVDQMLGEPGIDAISITTPNFTHASLAISALNAGKHVLCEKPPSLNVNDTLRMVECARTNKRILLFGFEGKFAEKIQYTRQYAEKGLIGGIYYAKAGYIRRCGNPGGWFATKELSGGGPLIDLGVHMIDLSLYLMGNPKPRSVFASTYHKFGNRSNLKGIDWYRTRNYQAGRFDTEDLAVAMVKFENDATLFLECSFDLHTKGMDEAVCLDIFGEKAGARVDPGYEIYSEKNDRLVDLKPDLNDNTINWDKCLEIEVHHFVDCIMNAVPCSFPAEDAIPVMQIVEAIYESSKTGISIQF